MTISVGHAVPVWNCLKPETYFDICVLSVFTVQPFCVSQWTTSTPSCALLRVQKCHTISSNKKTQHVQKIFWIRFFFWKTCFLMIWRGIPSMTSVSKPNVENSHFLSKLARCRSPLAIMCHIWTLFCPICAEISFGSSTSERPHTALGISGTREGYSNKENLEGRSSKVLKRMNHFLALSVTLVWPRLFTFQKPFDS